MKKQVILFIAVFFSSQLLRAQATPTQQMEDFINQKGDGFNKSYGSRDTKSFNSLLTEYLVIYEKLPTDEKKQYTYLLGNIYYNLTCIHSLLNNKSSALTYLQKAIDAGYNDYGNVQNDTDLDNIRNEKEFVELNKQLKQTGDYLSILKRAGEYNLSDNRAIPKFTYQTSDNPNLVALRKGFNLDSIAGQGTDVLQILNLMHWIQGYEIYPKNWLQLPFLKHKTASTHHNMHHEQFTGNYGLYFTFWDKWMKTEIKDYKERFNEVHSRNKM